MSWFTGKVNVLDNPGTPVTPSRAIGTSFVPSVTKYTLCMYTIQQVETTGQDGTVTLLCDAADPPTVEWGSTRTGNANAATHTTSKQIVCVAAPGDHVKLVASGTGTPTIVQQKEISLS